MSRILYHFLVEFHGRWKGLAVSAQDVAKVNVDEMPTLGQQEIVIVPVAHSEKIGYHAVASCIM